MQAGLQWLAVVSAALFAGGALYISVVEHPARMKAGVAVAVAEFRQMYKRAAPWQASAAALSLVSGVLAGLTTSEWAWGFGGVAVGAVIPFTLVFMMATNHRLLDSPAPQGNEAASLLRRWGRLHWVRSLLGTVGLIVLVSKVVLR